VAEIPARDRLDLPRSPSRLPGRRPRWDADTFGKVSEKVARFLGTWTFIGYMSAFVAAWVLWNIFAPEKIRWDDYPFIFLTLMLSLQASYAAPLILLAQNRQADRDRVTYEQDRARTERNIADTEYLTREIASLRVAIGEVATRDFVRSELSRFLDELDARDAREAREARDGREDSQREPRRDGGRSR
jgi:uncharacterized membrane protein